MFFLDEDTINKHKEYVHSLKLKNSILIKSFPVLAGKNIAQIAKIRINDDVKKEAMTTRGEIDLHEVYFESFSKERRVINDEAIKAEFGSVANMLFELKRTSSKIRVGFCGIALGRKKLQIFACEDYYSIFFDSKPIIAIDICEHAYFKEYSFDKEGYLGKAIKFLNVNKISEFCKRN